MFHFKVKTPLEARIRNTYVGAVHMDDGKHRHHRPMSTIRRIPGKNPLTGQFPKTLSPEAEAVHRKLVITNRPIELMEAQGVSRSELAKRMGVQPSRVTAMLSGTSNLTIDTLIRAGLALGAELHQTFVPAGIRAEWETAKHIVRPGRKSKTAVVSADL